MPRKHFQTVYVRHNQIFEKPGGVTLRGSRISKTEPIDKHGCILVAQPPDLDTRESPWTTQLLNAQAWHSSQGFGNRIFIPFLNVCLINNGNRLGNLVHRLRRPRSGYDHFVVMASHSESNVAHCLLSEF